MKGASYHVDQRLYDATTVGHFAKGGKSVQMEAYMPATRDLLVISLSAEGKEPVEGSVTLNLLIPDVPFPGIREEAGPLRKE